MIDIFFSTRVHEGKIKGYHLAEKIWRGNILFIIMSAFPLISLVHTDHVIFAL